MLVREKELPADHPWTDLQALSTDPARQREGAGTLLLEWAVQKLDSKGARGVLEASRAAVQHGFCERLGFRSVDDHTYVDKERFPTTEAITMGYHGQREDGGLIFTTDTAWSEDRWLGRSLQVFSCAFVTYLSLHYLQDGSTEPHFLEMLFYNNGLFHSCS